MQKYSSNIADARGNAVGVVSVAVTDKATGSLASLFSDNDVTKTLPNPFLTDALSNFAFYAANGRYSWSVSGAPFAGSVTDILLYDPNDDTSLQLADYTALRAYAGARQSVYVTGYLGSAAPSGIAGMFVRDDSDTTTADNGGTVIVAGNGKRWKRQYHDGASISWFGAKVDGVTNDTAAIQAAINVCRWTTVPVGTAIFTQITIPSNRKITGKGPESILKSATAGDGLSNAYPVNGSNAASVTISDLAVICTNGSNAGGGFAQTCGGYICLERVLFQGWKYGVIFDQTEIASISQCQLVSNSSAGIWLVNGPTRSAGAGAAFTNRITIEDNQFNLNPIGIIDDGGVSHTFEKNNFNGGQMAIRCAGALAVKIGKNEIEYCTVQGILFSDTRQSDGSGVGQCFEVSIDSNFMIASTNTPCVQINTGTNINLSNNELQSTGGASTAYAIQGCANATRLSSIGNKPQSNFVGMFDVVPTALFQTDDPTVGNRMTKAQFYTSDRTLSAMEVYCPVSFGGKSPIGGIDFSAVNTAATPAKVVYSRVAPGISDNTPGTESGALVFSARNAGTMTNLVTMVPGQFYPNADNLQQFGGPANRWTQLYAMNVALYPPASVSPNANGQMLFELTSDTTLKVKVKGSDGTVRSATLTLA